MDNSETELDNAEPQELTLAEPDEEISEEALRLSVLPIVELDRLLDATDGKLSNALFVLEAAEDRYARLTKRRNYSTDAAHAASFKEHISILVNAEDRLFQQAEAAWEQARNIDDATTIDREPVLSDEDMARANNRRAFVQEDCQSIPLRELLSRVQHAFRTEDVAALWLYLRYGSVRLQNPLALDKGRTTERGQLEALLANVADRLADKRNRQTNEVAKELRKRALEMQRRAYDRRTKREAAGRGRYGL